MQIKLIVVGNVKEIFYQNKIEEFQKQFNKKMSSVSRMKAFRSRYRRQ